MYFKPAETEEPLKIELSHTLLLVIVTLLTLMLGFIPNYVIEIFS